MITNQLIYFLKSILCGAVLGLIFDAFKILRLFIKHNVGSIFIEDVMFCIISSVITYGFMVDISYGQIRIFILVGELIGLILYKLSLSKLLITLIVNIVKLLKRILNFVFSITLLPVYKLILIVFKFIFKPVFKYLKKIFEKFKMVLKSKGELMYNIIKKGIKSQNT